MNGSILTHILAGKTLFTTWALVAENKKINRFFDMIVTLKRVTGYREEIAKVPYPDNSFENF